LQNCPAVFQGKVNAGGWNSETHCYSFFSASFVRRWRR
jgi:hypothetical protein